MWAAACCFAATVSATHGNAPAATLNRVKRPKQPQPVCIYSVTSGNVQTFGLLCRALASAAACVPDSSEIACTQCFAAPPDRWTYPQIQPLLLQRAAAPYVLSVRQHPDHAPMAAA